MEQDKYSPTAQKKVSNLNEKRMEQWKKKQSEINSKVSFKKTKKADDMVGLSPEFQKQDLPENKQRELLRATLCAATGSASHDFSLYLFTQIINNISVYEGNDEAAVANAALEALLALKPQDEIEGMLISRLLVLHDYYMRYLRGAKNSSDETTINGSINRATKLMRLYNETLESLNRHKRKGQQKITVQHVNVSDGGQAIVGNVKTGGGDNAKD